MARLSRPKPGEPIKIIKDGTGRTRYQTVVTTTPAGVKRRQARRNFDTLAQARDFVTRTRAAVREGRYQQPEPLTLQQLVDRWAAAKDVRQITLDGYLQAVAAVLRDHGGRRVQDIDRAEIERWKASWPMSGGLRGDGLSRRSIELALQVLKMIFDHGIRLKIITENPAAGIRPPRETLADEKKAAKRKTTSTVWSFGELRQFVAAADESELAAAMRLSACGLRRSEVLGLDWTAVDLETGVVTVEQGRTVAGVEKVKSKRSARTVNTEAMIPGTRLALLELWIAQGRPGSGPVVLDADGNPYDEDRYSREFRRIAEAAGLPMVHLHSLRHSIATELHRRGIAPAVGARLLGHSLQTHLSRYVLASDEHADEAAAAFGSAWEESA